MPWAECQWKSVLPPTDGDGKAHVITASSTNYGKVSISDVLFGDVWICGGQSNMVFTVPQVNMYYQFNIAKLLCEL